MEKANLEEAEKENQEIEDKISNLLKSLQNRNQKLEISGINITDGSSSADITESNEDEPQEEEKEEKIITETKTTYKQKEEETSMDLDEEEEKNIMEEKIVKKENSKINDHYIKVEEFEKQTRKLEEEIRNTNDEMKKRLVVLKRDINTKELIKKNDNVLKQLKIQEREMEEVINKFKIFKKVIDTVKISQQQSKEKLEDNKIEINNVKTSILKQNKALLEENKILKETLKKNNSILRKIKENHILEKQKKKLLEKEKQVEQDTIVKLNDFLEKEKKKTKKGKKDGLKEFMKIIFITYALVIITFFLMDFFFGVDIEADSKKRILLLERMRDNINTQ